MARVQLPSGTADRVRNYVAFIKGYILSTYKIDIRSLPVDVVDSIWAPKGPQPGMYLDGKIGSRLVGSKVLDDYANDKRVLIAQISEETGDHQYWGIIFHELGHAAFDVLGKNGEPAAWTVELMGLAAYQSENPGLAGAIKTFVQARRSQANYSAFAGGFESQAAEAYAAITGGGL